MRTTTAWAVLLTAILFGSGRSEAQPPTLHLTFGLYQSDKATVMYRTFVPVLEALEGRMEASLGGPVDIEIRIFKTYEEGIDALAEGTVDFVRFGPASFILARRKNADVQLLAMELKKGAREFLGVVVVKKDSPLRKLEELKGKRFAFGDPNSTIGRYLVQSELLRAGIRASDLSGYDFLKRHDVVARHVELGDFDAGSVKEGTFKKAKDTLRALHTFKNVTKPWIARADLGKRAVAALREGLLGMEDEAALKSLKISGFGKAEFSMYEPIRDAMERAEGFDGK